VKLLKAESLDPDILEEKSRAMLGLVGPEEVVVYIPR
jgi:cell division protein FtsB